MKLFAMKVKYVLRTLAKPSGTTFEIENKPVNRFVYAFSSLRAFNRLSR